MLVRKRRQKAHIKVLKLCTFYGSFSNDNMAVKGLNSKRGA